MYSCFETFDPPSGCVKGHEEGVLWAAIPEKEGRFDAYHIFLGFTRINVWYCIILVTV
jgi:hypothetical protein